MKTSTPLRTQALTLRVMQRPTCKDRRPPRAFWALVAAIVATTALSMAAADLDKRLAGTISTALIERLLPRAE